MDLDGHSSAQADIKASAMPHERPCAASTRLPAGSEGLRAGGAAPCPTLVGHRVKRSLRFHNRPSGIPARWIRGAGRWESHPVSAAGPRRVGSKRLKDMVSDSGQGRGVRPVEVSRVEAGCGRGVRCDRLRSPGARLGQIEFPVTTTFPIDETNRYSYKSADADSIPLHLRFDSLSEPPP